MQAKSIQKIVLVLVLFVLVGMFFILDLGQYFSLEYIKQSQQRFQALYAERTITVIAVYMAVYILATSLVPARCRGSDPCRRGAVRIPVGHGDRLFR